MRNEIHCIGCGALLGLTTREQTVRAQCLDPFCPTLPPAQHEDGRNGAILVAYDAGESAASIARELEMTRQGIGRVLESRVS